MVIPSYATKPYIGEPKFERPAILIRNENLLIFMQQVILI